MFLICFFLGKGRRFILSIYFLKFLHRGCFSFLLWKLFLIFHCNISPSVLWEVFLPHCNIILNYSINAAIVLVLKTAANWFIIHLMYFVIVESVFVCIFCLLYIRSSTKHLFCFFWPYARDIIILNSTDIPDFFSPPLSIVHCFRKVFRTTSRINTEQL